MQIKVWDQLLSINEIDIHGLNEEQITGLMRGAAGTKVMLRLETRRKRSRELKHVVLTRQLPSTFAPDMMTVSWMAHDGLSDSELDTYLPHLRSAREHVRSWTDSLSLVLRTQQDRPDDCSDPPQPPAAAEPAVAAADLQSLAMMMPTEGRNDEAERLEMRSDLLQRPRTYLIL